MKRIVIVLRGLRLAARRAPAHAGELFGGLYVHDVDTPLTHSGIEGGADVQLGWRGGRIGPTPLQPYVFARLNTAGDTNYAAAGISAKFGDRLYVRPGLGIAVHTGSAANFQRTDRIAFGSRILFEPELGIGYRDQRPAQHRGELGALEPRPLFGRQNPGHRQFRRAAELEL